MTDVYKSMARFVWSEEETGIFLNLIREKDATAILDTKYRFNAFIKSCKKICMTKFWDNSL